MRVSYVGHATLLLDFGGTRLLTDPNYDSRLAGVLPRVSRPGIALEEMPRPDAVLLSHAHADHLSFRTLDRLPRDVPVVAPPALARWLDRRARRNGRRRGGTIALAPGASLRVGGVAISAGAAWHMGARYGLDRWRGASNMYLIDDGATACLFAGDTAAGACGRWPGESGPAGAGRRLDLALLPIGRAPWWKRASFRRGHLTADDALALFEQLGARYFVPYHWGTFRHVTSGPYDAIRELRSRLATHARRADVRILEPGAAFELIPERA